MKKVFVLLLATILILGSFAAVYANEISPFYIGTASHLESLSISSGGLADFGATLDPKTATTFDRVNITLELVNEDTGSTVYKSIANTTYDSIAGAFRNGETDFQLESRGDYYLYVTYKCYKNSTLIETISGGTAETY